MKEIDYDYVDEKTGKTNRQLMALGKLAANTDVQGLRRLLDVPGLHGVRGEVHVIFTDKRQG